MSATRYRRGGDGTEMSEQFPFEERFKVSVAEPHNLSLTEITIEVDASSCYGVDDGLDFDETGKA